MTPLPCQRIDKALFHGISVFHHDCQHGFAVQCSAFGPPAVDALGSRPMIRLALLLLALSCAFGVSAQDATNPYGEDAVVVTVTAPYIDMHTGPGRSYPIYHVTLKHETLYLLKRRTHWYKVGTADGFTGWVWREDLHDSLAEDGAPLDFSLPGWEGYRESRWELGLTGGTFSGARALGVHLGYRMTPNLSTEIHVSQAFGNFSDSKLATVNLVHRPFPEWRITPFFTLGAGTAVTSPNAALVETEDRQDNLLSVGGGLVFYLSQRFSLRAQYHHHTLLTTRESNEEVDEWKAGFSVSF